MSRLAGVRGASGDALLPPLHELGDESALRFGDRELSYRELRSAAAAVARRLHGAERAAVWAESTLETCIAVVGGLGAGVPLVPLNPKLGATELRHVLEDSRPEVVLGAPDRALPDLDRQPRTVMVNLDDQAADLPIDDGGGEAPALIVYTSGTTGAPKGAVLPRRAIASNLDALAEAWELSGDDRLAHALPLFHVHGLVLGLLGPLRLGGQLQHLVRFDTAAVTAAFEGGATVLFGVPTMYHRLAAELEHDAALADALRGARLLVSGSAALAGPDFDRVERATGQRVAERYGLTETLMNTAVRASGERRPGYVGEALSGVELRLVGDDGEDIEASDDETIGELAVRGPNLFSGYLNRPDATDAAVREGWFFTGDLATRAPDGYWRIVGRRSTDLIKTGGYKVGALEVEGALLAHPGVAEVAVTGAPDEDLGERIVAWVVADEAARAPAAEELADHVARELAPHKRPRDIHFVDELPRNAMGKVVKGRLAD
jgi:malonyl-CoA/methylmalonyl-CoA synthetase